jgi:hypothetical protein
MLPREGDAGTTRECGVERTWPSSAPRTHPPRGDLSASRSRSPTRLRSRAGPGRPSPSFLDGLAAVCAMRGGRQRAHGRLLLTGGPLAAAPSADPDQAFAAAVRRVLSGRERYQAGLQEPVTRQRFSWEQQAQTLIAIYDRLIFGAPAVSVGEVMG